MDLYAQWKALSLGSDKHIQASYNEPNSWTLGYNLFADVWLGTEVVESSVCKRITSLFTSFLIIYKVYNGHSAFIDNITLVSFFGNQTLSDSDFPYSSDSEIGESQGVTISCWWFYTSGIRLANAVPAWNLFVAAMTPINDLRLKLIERVHNRASSFGRQNMGIFPVRYGSVNGSDMSGMAR